MARPIQVPQRAGVLRDPILYESVSRVVNAVNDVLTAPAEVGRTPILIGETIKVTAPIIHVRGTETIESIAEPPFYTPLTLIADDGLTLGTNGNIAVGVPLRPGDSISLTYDHDKERWYPTNGDGGAQYATPPIPHGAILMWGNAAAPTGWLLCDGTVVVRATYPDLFAVIGTTFNTGGEAGTDFRLPNMQQRFPLGKAAAGTGSTLGGTGGLIDHTHTLSAHTHNIDHDHTILNEDLLSTQPNMSFEVTATPGSGSWAAAGWDGAVIFGHIHRSPVGDYTVGNISTDTSSGPDPLNTGTANPPFLALNFIIKT